MSFTTVVYINLKHQKSGRYGALYTDAWCNRFIPIAYSIEPNYQEFDLQWQSTDSTSRLASNIWLGLEICLEWQKFHNDGLLTATKFFSPGFSGLSPIPKFLPGVSTIQVLDQNVKPPKFGQLNPHSKLWMKQENQPQNQKKYSLIQVLDG